MLLNSYLFLRSSDKEAIQSGLYSSIVIALIETILMRIVRGSTLKGYSGFHQIVDMDGYKLPLDLISTPMSKVTIEERDELLRQNEAMKKELEYIKKTSEKQMYINDLDSLRKDLEKDFK